MSKLSRVVFVQNTKAFRKKLYALAATIAVVGGLSSTLSFAATPSLTIEAESFAFPASQTWAVNPEGSTEASLWWDTTGTKDVTLDTRMVKLNTVLRGAECDGWPIAEIKVDGNVVLRQAVESSTYITLSVPVNVAPGSHTISLAMVNDYARRNAADPTKLECDRNLFADKLILQGEPNLDPSTTFTGSVLHTVSANTLNYGSVGTTTSYGGMVWSGGGATQGTFTLPSATTSVVLSAFGDQCQGAPQANVVIDGTPVFTGGIDATTATTYVAAKNLTAGNHTVQVSLLNDFKTTTCDRNIHLTKLEFRGTPPPVTASPFYLDTNRSINNYVNSIRTSQPANAALLDKIANTPSGVWIGGYSGDDDQLTRALNDAKTKGTVPVIVLYGVPFRDNGQESSGGFPNYTEYAKWIDWAAAKIGTTKTIVIIEPDSVAQSVPDDKKAERRQSLTYATQKMGALQNTKAYLDAGTLGWRTPEDMATRLKAVGIDKADGIAVNVSNFHTTTSVADYGKKISALIGNKPIVIDVSRNGNGPLPGATGEDAWCNPAGRALGVKPTYNTGIAGVDALLWVKTPGTSDGACNGGPKAGDLYISYALELARNAKW